MKRRSLIAIILAVVCLMTSLSVYASDYEKCDKCTTFTRYCSGIESERTSESHTVYIGDDDMLICNYTRVLYYIALECKECKNITLGGVHRHAEIGHICGWPEDRCTYPHMP